MITTIKEYFLLKEDRNAPVLPFEEDEHGKKTVHEHLIDALIDLRTIKDYKNYYSNNNPDVAIENAFTNLFKKPDDIEYTDQILLHFIYKNKPFDDDYNITNEYDIWNDNFLLKNKNNIIDDDNIVLYLSESFENGIYNIKDAFSKNGLKQYNIFIQKTMYENIYKMQNIINESYNNSDSGLIDIWRMVDYIGDDIYHEIVNKYNGVGIYWTWDEDSPEAYWSNGQGHSITLHGTVSIENVNWERTIEMNAGSFTEEKEIRLNENGSVMIIGFYDNILKKYYDFETPYIVKTGNGTR